MASLEELREVRLQKLQLLKDKGIDPYPAVSTITSTVAEAIKNFDTLASEVKSLVLGGRIMSLRSQGAITFFNFFDGTGTFQALLKNDDTIDQSTKDSFELFSKVTDIGDFVEVTGTLFVTKTGQQTIQVTNWRMLAKSLRPLPEKWHGLQDVEERYRKRYLDILTNPELRDLFEKKSKFWDVTRNFLKSKGFLEVETPTLEVTTGGAEANPFKTHHNDYDMPVYLRISVGELWQKRLMAAGFPKTFEIGRLYRNEGSSPEHLQEFTNMEFYWGYANFEDGMNLVQEMYTTIAQEVFGTTKFTTRGHTFDLADEWKIVDYKDEIKRQTGVDIITASDKEITAKLDELGVKYDGTNRERLTDTLWKYCRKGIAGPAFLINHPKLVAPLAKANPNDPTTVQRFQPILAGSEVGNGYSELNDPIDQRQRFELQQKLIESGDEEAMMPEWEFVDMLEHGMPPTCGFGFGERLFAFFVDKPVRETQLFPLMKPEDAEGSAGKKSKDKDTKVAVAVINKGSKLEAWQELNTIGHLSAAFGARTGKNLFSQPHITTKDGQHINLNIQHAIVIKEAHATADLKTLVAHAKKAGLIIEEFTREMIETTNDKKVAAKTKEKNHEEIEYLGVLVFGPKSSVDEFTSSFALYSGK